MEITYEPTIYDLVIGLVTVAILLLIIVGYYFVRKNKEVDGIDRKFVRERWKKIEELFAYGKEMNYKLAVIEADKLLDEVLKSMYFGGNTMADRLKLASYKFPKLKRVWWAHKVRNLVVHDARYALRHGETKVVLRLFKRALKEFNAL